MKFFDRATVQRLFPMPAAIEVMDQVMRGVSAGRAEIPLRQIIRLSEDNLFGVMSGALRDPTCFGAKLISIFPANTKHGLSSHLGLVVLFEAERGQPIAVLDAGAITAIRTAATSGAATRALARPDASVLAIIGTGEQAHHHLSAMLAVRPIKEARMVGRTPERAHRFVAEFAPAFPGVHLRACGDSAAAARGSDIICTVTNSAAPVLESAWVDDGTHLNIVGASVRAKQEIDENLVARASVFVDRRASAFAEAGEIIAAIESGRINAQHIIAEIGETLSSAARGRVNAHEVTLYRSLGIAAQDLASAKHIYDRAKAETG